MSQARIIPRAVILLLSAAVIGFMAIGPAARDDRGTARTANCQGTACLPPTSADALK